MSVHPVMRQNFAGKPSPIFYNIWDPVLYLWRRKILVKTVCWSFQNGWYGGGMRCGNATLANTLSSRNYMWVIPTRKIWHVRMLEFSTYKQVWGVEMPHELRHCWSHLVRFLLADFASYQTVIVSPSAPGFFCLFHSCKTTALWNYQFAQTGGPFLSLLYRTCQPKVWCKKIIWWVMISKWFWWANV